MTARNRMIRRVLALLLVCATAPARARDPEGTIVLELGVGESAPVKSTPGANVLCDDPAIASGEFTADGNGFVIRAHRIGTTLCGVWLAGQTPGGLYRVQVKAPAGGGADAGPAPPPPDAGSAGPAADAGGGDR